MDGIISEFMVRTCRILPKTNTNVLESIDLETVGSESKVVIACGSCTEFFIQPLHSCIDDIDYFFVKLGALVFTDEKPVLPYDFRNISDTGPCLLMEPYPDYPAYVRLRPLGLMRYNWERKTFEFIEMNSQTFLTTTEINGTANYEEEWHTVGPAKRVNALEGYLFSANIDIVESIWCPQWPKEAIGWPLRQRKYGWPTTAIIHEIVQSGCHVVFSKHPCCRSDEYQCRLSFSVAEVILLQSWTPEQQMVYHMLRYFAKRELIRKDCPKEDEVLCSYHFKTLMLWSCEEMSPEWWNSFHFISICCNLLKTLAKWLNERRCRNYFIPQANLFHEDFNQNIVDETDKKLDHYCDSDILSFWFVKHYIKPPSIFGAIDEIRPACSVYMYMIAMCEAERANRSKAFDFYFRARYMLDVKLAHNRAKKVDRSNVNFHKNNLRIIGPAIEETLKFRPSAEIESMYWLYGSMLRILHAVHLLNCREMHFESQWFVDEIRQVLIKPKRIRSMHHNLPRPLSTDVNYRSQLYLIKAQDLMEHLTASNDDLEFQIVSEISKALLRKALECKDSKTKTIAKATLTYKAALHFAASEYETVIDLCSTLVMSDKPEKEDTETLNAGCLLYIEDIVKIIGFYLIYQKAKDPSLHYTRRPSFLDLRLTPEVLVHYLTISSIQRTGEAFEPNNISQTPSFPLDAILMTITNSKFSRIPTNAVKRFETPDESYLPNEDSVIKLLMEYSLRNMTLHHNETFKYFGIQCSIDDCYRAAYLYQCRKYPNVLNLCERILDETDLQKNLQELVLVLPPLDSFFDKEVRCLRAFHTLFFYLSPLYEDLPKVEEASKWTLKHFFSRKFHSDKHLITAVLGTNIPAIACHYYIRRRFLARYLKVRCLIDCCNPLSEAMFEFEKLKTSLPFEHMIRLFLNKNFESVRKK